MLDLEERRAVEAALWRFAQRVERTLFAGEEPDGDLDAVPTLLAEAREMGLLTDAGPEGPGYALGVWGRACLEEGLGRSLLTLSILAQVCAGLATAVHAQGLACLALNGQRHFPVATPLAAVFTPNYGVPLSAQLRETGSGLQVTEDAAGKALQLHGTGHFLLSAARPEKLVCFAQQAETTPEWVALVVDVGAAGLELIKVTQRTGLRAARQYHLHCDQVSISREAVLYVEKAARRALARVLACDWLGQAAIALGVARRSLRDSRAYTAERYQGGRMIQEHASIQLLQGSAEYDVALLDAILHQHADQPLSAMDPDVLLRWAVQARLAVVEHAHRAVTDCLQTLGGYGYVADYGFEKRLRDVSTLKSLHGAPDQLWLFLNELARGDG
jgi:alkylation response protein AidB-like acyl-CoA dehydrogenase